MSDKTSPNNGASEFSRSEFLLAYLFDESLREQNDISTQGIVLSFENKSDVHTGRMTLQTRADNDDIMTLIEINLSVYLHGFRG
jgi:hypothetical protein